MARTDLIADSITMIRNAVMVNKESVVIPASKMARAILEIFKSEGYIENFKEQAAVGAAKTLKVYLKYESGSPAIQGIKRVSRPGLRKYFRAAKMPSVLRGFGRAIVSTSKGLMTDIQAKQDNLGGEVVCYIW